MEFLDSSEFQFLMAPFGAAFGVSTGQTSAEGVIYRFYQAVFDRQPDVEGYINYVNTLQLGEASQFMINPIIRDFLSSQEFQDTYGNLTNAEFVDALYENVLPGNTDPVGRENFTNALNAPMDDPAA